MSVGLVSDGCSVSLKLLKYTTILPDKCVMTDLPGNIDGFVANPD